MLLGIQETLQWIENNIVWGIPLIVLILGTGIILTVRLRGIQFTHLGKSLKYMVANDNAGSGEVSSFGALCISMAATLGTGKIVGVATAIYWGGPGALFWMIFAAIFGMATKYSEGFLAIKFRKVLDDGEVIGGPFAYIEKGMGEKWKWLACMFAIFGALAALLGIGTMTQMNSINESIISVFDPEVTHTVNIFGNSVSTIALIATAIVTFLAAYSVIGGVKRISTVSSYVVPVMAVGYFLVSILIVIFNIGRVPEVLLTIIKYAFTMKAGLGALAGIGITKALSQGISKGIFSNEAGLGSAPIALSTGKNGNAVKQGLACMSTTFIDTFVLCLTIGLGIVITGTYQDSNGLDITINAFSNGLHIGHTAAATIVMVSIVSFAFTTVIGWNVYGEKCIAYLTNNNKKWIMVYKILYIITIAIAPLLTLDLIWTISSISNGLMALPNLVGLLGLSGVVARETKEYFENKQLAKEYENE